LRPLTLTTGYSGSNVGLLRDSEEQQWLHDVIRHGVP